MTPVPEPDGDLRAQLRAVLDPEHPKVTMFVVPGNEIQIPVGADVFVVSRRDGTLITSVLAHAASFTQYGAADEGHMAWLLDYPEDKDEVVRACRGDLRLAQAVQARDAEGNVVTEAFVSPGNLTKGIEAMQAHVPAGGSVCTLSASASIMRRLLRSA